MKFCEKFCANAETLLMCSFLKIKPRLTFSKLAIHPNAVSRNNSNGGANVITFEKATGFFSVPWRFCNCYGFLLVFEILNFRQINSTQLIVR